MEILLKYFPGLSPLQKEQYSRLHDLVVEWNRRINLISRKDIEHLYERHILHSLGIALHARFTPTDTVLDVGTGGGFPGLPLAIIFPETRFTLIDSIGKKVHVVNEISRSLELENVQCIQVRAENFRGKIHHVVCRAVTSLDRLTGWVRDKLVEVPEEGSQNGIWYLKGGDLVEELRPFPEAKVFDLKGVLREPFFESKKLVWLPRFSLL
ncbi:MAG: 16S rRNA (guanine(527)-N(7))-methyltransferase RsmG [Bacteroidales bacterium]|nr:16S rRNA (guanine(527)-N(7))-methyltransferase RsmG [Bacteroidales bacterium]